jgi:hypothetical protein
MSNDSKQNIHKLVKQAALKQELERLQPNFINIDEFYKDALIRWYYHTSDIKKAIAELKFSETEQSKVITENDFCKTKDGFQLTESDFIKVELKRFEIIEPDKLSLIENKRFEFYKEFLLARIKQPATGTRTDDWFVVGLLFANGEMDKLLKTHNRNATQIASELGRSGLRGTISDSIGANIAAKKNLFNYRDKMLEIIEHCRTHDIDIQPSFSDRLPPE